MPTVTRPGLTGLDAEQQELVRAYCALWVVVQGQVFGSVLHHHASGTLAFLRHDMSSLARLRCSQFEGAWSQKAADA